MTMGADCPPGPGYAISLSGEHELSTTREGRLCLLSPQEASLVNASQVVARIAARGGVAHGHHRPLLDLARRRRSRGSPGPR